MRRLAAACGLFLRDRAVEGFVELIQERNNAVPLLRRNRRRDYVDHRRDRLIAGPAGIPARLRQDDVFGSSVLGCRADIDKALHLKLSNGRRHRRLRHRHQVCEIGDRYGALRFRDDAKHRILRHSYPFRKPGRKRPFAKMHCAAHPRECCAGNGARGYVIHCIIRVKQSRIPLPRNDKCSTFYRISRLKIELSRSH